MCMQVWVPDSKSRMAPASTCFFNDAAWLDSGDLRMVYPSIDNGTAELLGCKSLRIQHQVRLTLILLANVLAIYPPEVSNMGCYGDAAEPQHLEPAQESRQRPASCRFAVHLERLAASAEAATNMTAACPLLLRSAQPH